MDDRDPRLEARMEALAASVRAIERRLDAIEAALERIAGLSDGLPAVTQAGTIGAAAPAAGGGVQTTLSLIGRTLVVLGGAYLLRALTDSGFFSRSQGIVVGVAYALVWLLSADRAGGKGRRDSAAFHGLAAALIGYPLLSEATFRFKLLTPDASAAAIGAFTALALVVAWRRKLEGVAWVTSLGAVLAAVVLMIVGSRLRPYSALVVLLGVATLWLSYLKGSTVLRWPIAWAGNLTVVAMTVAVTGRGSSDSVSGAIRVQILMLAAYLGTIAARTLILGRDIVPFELVQSIAVLVVGFGGAVYLTRATGAVATLGYSSLLFGVASYAVAFAFVERRQERRRNFYFYTSLAAALTLAGTGLLLAEVVLSQVWAAVALGMTLLARRYSRVTLGLHGAAYLVAAAYGSGLAAAATSALVAEAVAAWPPVTWSAAVALAAVAICTALPVANPSERWGPYASVPRVVILALLALGTGGVAVALAAPALADAPGQAADPGVLSTVRTAVLSAAVLLLAWARRYPMFFEAGWFVHPILVVIGVKFLIEDLPVGRPATLFLALALYGIALIAGPRLLRRAG